MTHPFLKAAHTKKSILTDKKQGNAKMLGAVCRYPRNFWNGESDRQGSSKNKCKPPSSLLSTQDDMAQDIKTIARKVVAVG